MAERVDFYVLGSAARAQRWGFACRLTAKAYLSDLSVIIWSEGDADAKIGDDLLWTFSDSAFVPHQISLDSIDPGIPVHLVVALGLVAGADVLVNLSDRLPSGSSASRESPRSSMRTRSAGSSGGSGSRRIGTANYRSRRIN